MLRGWRKIFSLLVMVLAALIFTNEDANAAKTACKGTELWIDRGSVRQAERAAKKPGAEMCGILVVQKFYPKKLNKTRAIKLTRIAREFVSRTSPLYPQMLSYLIQFDLEPKKLKKNFLEAIKSPAQKKDLMRLRSKKKKILRDFVSSPGKDNPPAGAAIIGNWHAFFGVEKCVRNLNSDILSLKSKFDINVRQLDEKDWPSVNELREATRLLKKIDRNYKDNCGELTSKNRAKPEIAMRSWLVDGDKYLKNGQMYLESKNKKKIKYGKKQRWLSRAIEASIRMGDYDRLNLQKEKISEILVEAEKFIGQFIRSPSKFKRKNKKYWKIKKIKSKLPKNHDFSKKLKVILMYTECYNAGNIRGCVYANNHLINVLKDSKRLDKEKKNVRHRGTSLSRIILKNSLKRLLKAKKKKEINKIVKRVEKQEAEIISFDLNKKFESRIKDVRSYKKIFYKHNPLMLPPEERFRIAEEFFSQTGYHSIDGYLNELSSELTTKSRIFPGSTINKARTVIKEFYKSLCSAYAFGTPGFTWLRNKRLQKLESIIISFEGGINEVLRNFVISHSVKNTYRVKNLPNIGKLGCSGSNGLSNIYTFGKEIFKYLQAPPDLEALKKLQEQYDLYNHVIPSHLFSVKDQPSEKKNQLDRTRESEVLFADFRCRNVVARIEGEGVKLVPYKERCHYASKMEMLGDMHLLNFLNKDPDGSEKDLAISFYNESRTIREYIDNDLFSTNLYNSPSFDSKLELSEDESCSFKGNQGTGNQCKDLIEKLKVELDNEINEIIDGNDCGSQHCVDLRDYVLSGYNNKFPLTSNLKLHRYLHEQHNQAKSFSKLPGSLNKAQPYNVQVNTSLPACPSDQKQRYHNCFGTLTYANGDEYVGEFRNDKFHGQGTYTFGPKSKWAGDKYVGEYRDGKSHGQGTLTYANGDEYVGEFRNDKFHGQGTLTYANGRILFAHWRDGVQRPESGSESRRSAKISKTKNRKKSCRDSAKPKKCKKAKVKNGTYEGQWTEGRMHGEGIFTFDGGSYYKGEFKNNKRHGSGRFYHEASGLNCIGTWKADKLKKLKPGDATTTKRCYKYAEDMPGSE